MNPTAAQIEVWIRQQQVRLGIGSTGNPVEQPTVTAYPSPYVIERLAHAGADLLIANNPAYDAQCARTDAMLAEILEGGTGLVPPLPRSKHSRQSGNGPRIMRND